MRAVLFEDVGSISVGDYPTPSLLDDTDAIIRVTTAAICGSDLHLLHGRIPGMRQGSVIGHEFVGVIEQVGSGVTAFAPGDRVVGSFLVACGACWACRRGEYNVCDRMWALGYGMFVGDLDGCQAEYVRMPGADLNLHAVGDLTDEQAIFAGDILTTGAYICARSSITEGDTVAIIGAGPVGIFTLMNARAYKPGRVFMIDQDAERLAYAASLGAIPVNASLVNPVIAVQHETEDRGADVVIDCVGAPPAFQTALDVVRAGGTIGVIGVYTEPSFDYPLGEVWRRGITIVNGGTCNVQAHWDDVLRWVGEGLYDPTEIISHTLPLEDAVKGYELFASREAQKVILKP